MAVGVVIPETVDAPDELEPRLLMFSMRPRD